MQTAEIFQEKFDTAVSLGVDCRVRYQISLSRHKRAHSGPLSLQDFERALYAANREVQPDGTFPFDWWVTPFKSVLKCVENDFAGLFDRGALEIHTNGAVRDREYEIIFPHAFPRENGKVTPDILESEYQAQHRKVQYLVGKFRSLQDASKANLYVVCGGTLDQLRQLRETLSSTQPLARLLSVQMVDATEGVTHEEPGITIYQMTRENRKPPAAQWQGDNEHWGELLDRIAFR